jgi:hypothetical protein
MFQGLRSWSLLRYLEALVKTQPLLSMSQNLQAIPCLASYHLFPQLLSGDHESTSPCSPHCLYGEENWSQEFLQGEDGES